MSDRGAAPAPAPMAAAATEQQIAEALGSLLRDANNTFTSLNGVVQQLESRLGVELGHKIDFIRNQIQHFFFLQQTQAQQGYAPQLHHHHHQKDHFAPQQTLNFQSGPMPPQHLPPNYGFRPQQLQPQHHHPQSSQAPPPPQAVKNPRNVAAQESAPAVKRKRGGPGGLNKLCGVSPVLQTIVGQPTLPRTEIVKQLWAYIRKNNLQDPNNKRKIICNDELRLVFETDCTDMFKMNKLLAKHILTLEPTKQTAQSAKKPKADVESGSKTDDTVPIVMISEALASLFGTDEREMSQAEVLRQMWEYVKVNQLEDPSNSANIICDAKLQEILGCESISALGIPEMLARSHLFKKS